MIRRPPSLHRVAVDCRYPCFAGRLRLLKAAPSLRYYSDAKTSRHPSRRSFVSFATAVPRLRRAVSLPRGATTLATGAWGARLERPPADAAVGSVEMAGSPKFPHRPLCRPAHAPSTPDRPDETHRIAPPDAATGQGTAVALSMDFRGSIAWLDGSLSTLQSTGSPRHDARLASDCAATLYRVGFTPTGPAMKSFSFVLSSHRILLSRACLAQSPFMAPK